MLPENDVRDPVHRQRAAQRPAGLRRRSQDGDRTMTKRDEVVVVCIRITTYYLATGSGRCSECGWNVQYRPHAPRGRRLCAEWADVVIGTGAKEKVTTTPRM